MMAVTKDCIRTIEHRCGNYVRLRLDWQDKHYIGWCKSCEEAVVRKIEEA